MDPSGQGLWNLSKHYTSRAEGVTVVLCSGCGTRQAGRGSRRIRGIEVRKPLFIRNPLVCPGFVTREEVLKKSQKNRDLKCAETSKHEFFSRTFAPPIGGNFWDLIVFLRNPLVCPGSGTRGVLNFNTPDARTVGITFDTGYCRNGVCVCVCCVRGNNTWDQLIGYPRRLVGAHLCINRPTDTRFLLLPEHNI